MKDFYTVQEVASALGVTRQRVYQMIHKGFIRAERTAVEESRLVITRQELDKLRQERLGKVTYVGEK